MAWDDDEGLIDRLSRQDALARRLEGSDLIVGEGGDAGLLVSDRYWLAPLSQVPPVERLLKWWNLPTDRPGHYRVDEQHIYPFDDVKTGTQLLPLWEKADECNIDVPPMTRDGRPLFEFIEGGNPPEALALFEHPKGVIGFQRWILTLIGWQKQPLRMSSEDHLSAATFAPGGTKVAVVAPMRLA